MKRWLIACLSGTVLVTQSLLPAKSAFAFHKAGHRDARAIRTVAAQAWRKATRGGPCDGEAMPYRGALISSANRRYALASISDTSCTYGFGWYVHRPKARSEKWKVLLSAPDSGQQCTYFNALPNAVQRDFGVQGMYHAGGYGPCAHPPGPSKLFHDSSYQNGTTYNYFSARPKSIVLPSADGGEVDVTWDSWKRNSAIGSGTAHPDQGSYPVQVKAEYPAQGVFTYLKITNDLNGTPHTNTLVLTYGLDDPTWVSWVRKQEVGSSSCGCSAWPPPGQS